MSLHFADQLRALIATEACDFSPGRWMDWLWHPRMHGDEVPAAPCYGLIAPHRPEEYQQETRGVLRAEQVRSLQRGSLVLRADHDFRQMYEQIPGTVPIYFMTGVYDWACTPEKTQGTASRVKNIDWLAGTEVEAPIAQQ